MNSNLSTKYFEKFYDIELNLPEANYKELNEPEFQVVNSFKEYKVDKNNYSENRDLVIQKIFLDMIFVVNDSFSKISIRSIKKLLKKFNILKDSLIEKEKEQHILILLLIEYFLKKELNLKYDTIITKYNKHRLIEEYFIKINMDDTRKNLILKVLENGKINRDDVNFLDDGKDFYKNEEYKKNNYKITIFRNNIYFQNFKSAICSNLKNTLYLSVDIEETDILLWLERKYNFIK